MRRMILFAFLMIVVAAAWYVSIPYLFSHFGKPTSLAEAGDMFGGINALFSGLALAGVIYAVILQTEDVKTNQKNLAKSIEANKISAELVALAALMQEGDSALERYERWTEKNPQSDYKKAQAKVRKNMKSYRERIERRLSEIDFEE